MRNWRLLRIGTRKSDGWVAINIVAGRACFLGYSDRNSENVLEPLTMDLRLRRIGVLIWAHNWRNVYFLRHRTEWLPDDYFIHAARIMGERGISEP